MRTTLRWAVSLAAATILAAGTSLVGSGAASAEPADVAAQPDCPASYICFYQDTNYRYPRLALHVSLLYDCGIVLIADNWASSVHNNTKFAFELWDISANPNYLVGTAAPFKAYGYFGPRGNDAIDTVVSPGCI